MIKTANLSIGYSSRSQLASGINLMAARGETIALMGANGIGKSTLLRTLCGELPSLAGEIWLDGLPLKSLKLRKRARIVSVVASSQYLAGRFTVRELVSLGRHPHTGFLGRMHDADNMAVNTAMKAVGITELQDRQLDTLSDGQKQKAAIARALAQDTPLMLLDEPLSFLDPAGRIEIFSLLRNITEAGKCVVLSCHDVSLALRLATRLWLLDTSRTLHCATPAEAVKTGLMDTLFHSDDAKFSPQLADFIPRNL